MHVNGHCKRAAQGARVLGHTLACKAVVKAVQCLLGLHACNCSLPACSFSVLVSLGTRWPARTIHRLFKVMTSIAVLHACEWSLQARSFSVLVSLGTRWPVKQMCKHGDNW
jgi:hypothetical protein